MGTAYDSRNDSSNNIADGNVINAADLDGEFDAILAAFGTGGHSHDGTAGEGGAIEKIGPSQQFLTDSGSFYPSASSLDLGKTGNQWDNIYIDGKAYIDGLGEDILVDTAFKIQFRDSDIYINSGDNGELDLVADGEIDIVAPIVDIDASTRVDISGDVTIGDDLTMGSDGAIINFGADSDIVLTHVADTGLKLSSVATGNLLHLQSTEAGATAGPVVIIERDSASPADNDFGGSILFKADSDTGTSRNIAKITTQVKDVSNGTEDSEVIFSNIVAGTETAQITLGTGITFGTALTINSGINVDNFNIDGTTIALSSGDMTLDTAGDIVLDADGDEVIFKNGSTNIGHVSMDSSNLTIKSLVSDKDMIFKGNDGGSEITALTLDMSEAGAATFNDKITVGGNVALGDNSKVVCGGDSDLQIFHDGSNSFVSDSGTGDLRLTGSTVRILSDAINLSNAANNADMITAASGGAVTLAHSGSTKLATSSTGVTVTGTLSGDTSGLHTGTVRRSSSHPTFTLPDADGSAGQFLKTDGSGELAFATAVTSITLGTDTSGNYAAAVTAGTGVSVSGSAGEGTTFQVSIGQAVGTGSNVTFNQVTSGSFLYSSDETLKDDIKTIESPVEKLKQLRGVSYTWNENSNLKGKKDIGLIAQEVEKVLPELVEVSDVTNTKTINYGHLIGLLVEAVKELDKNKCECGK